MVLFSQAPYLCSLGSSHNDFFYYINFFEVCFKHAVPLRAKCALHKVVKGCKEVLNYPMRTVRNICSFSVLRE